jgi:hypothetical protein
MDYVNIVNNMISLEYTKKGIPFINMGEHGRLTFSKLTAHSEKGYKFICYNRQYMDKIRIKKKVDGKTVEKLYKAPTRDSYTFDMRFQRKTGQQTKGIPRNTIPTRLGDWLRKTFKKYITTDKYFPYENIKLLEEEIEKAKIKTILSKPQRKRRMKKKKGKKNG